MVEDRIGYRYAKSAFELAEEKGTLEDAHSDMGLFMEVWEQNRDFRAMLDSPLVKSDRKQLIIDAIFGKHFQSELVKLLVSMVVRKGREMFLPQVARAFLQLYDQAKGIGRGVITSAIPLADEEVKAIQRNLEESTGKTYELTEEVNPDLIGGFTLKVDDNLFDGSVVSSLRRARQRLNEGA
jgi:F-type H+-transporting ATPase subunit delta